MHTTALCYDTVLFFSCGVDDITWQDVLSWLREQFASSCMCSPVEYLLDNHEPVEDIVASCASDTSEVRFIRVSVEFSGESSCCGIGSIECILISETVVLLLSICKVMNDLICGFILMTTTTKHHV